MHALCWRLLRGHLPRIPQQLQSSDAAELTHCVALLRALHRQSNACALRWHEPLPRGVRSVSRAAAAPAADSEVRRQSRTANKREARKWTDLAEQLCGLGGRNLAAVLSLADEALCDAVELAQRIPHRNQGRRRQVNLVGKLLRELPDAESGRLEAAVQGAVLGRGPGDSHDAERLAANWFRGLLAGDQAVVSEVFGLPLDWGADHQELRQLTRGAQQEAADEEQAGIASVSDVPMAKAKTGIKGTKLRRVLRSLASRLLEEQQSELSGLNAEGDEGG